MIRALTRTTLVLGCALALLSYASPIRAGVVWDYSPGTTGATLFPDDTPPIESYFENFSGGRNPADLVTFVSDTSIEGMDIYTVSSIAALGQSVIVRLWGDNGGTPGTLLNSVTSTVTVVDQASVGVTDGSLVRAYAGLASPLTLTGGILYWIGMSSANSDLGHIALTGQNAPGDGRLARFATGTSFDEISGMGDLAFRLHGQTIPPTSAVPEPSTLGSAALAAVLAGLYAHRRRRPA